MTAQRHANTTMWERYVFGKLVQEHGGAIIPGSEHGCTGITAGFPPELVELCHPSKLGLGEQHDSIRSRRSPWSSVGAISSAVTHVENTPWLIFARVRERPEGGEAGGDRRYVEAHYTAAKAKDFRPGMLVSLEETLQASPLLKSASGRLPPFTFHDQDIQLPKDWQDNLAGPMRSVLSGVSWSEQNWDLSIGDFIKTATMCLELMPRTIAWRLPVEAGVVAMHGKSALGCGMMAISGLRVIDKTPRNLDDFNFEPGDRYLEWLRVTTAGCRTTHEVRARLKAELPEFSTDDAIDVTVNWRHAVTILFDSMSEHRSLAAAVTSARTGEIKALPNLNKFRARFAAAVLSEIAHCDADMSLLAILDEIAVDWPESVREVASSEVVRDVGPEVALTGLMPILEPRSLVKFASWDLPERMSVRLAHRIKNAVERSDASCDWTSVFLAGATSNWLLRAFEVVWGRLVWLMFRGEPFVPELAHLGRLPRNKELDQITRMLDTGECPEKKTLVNFLQARRETDRHSLDRIVDMVLRKSPRTALVICEMAGRDTRLARCIASSPVVFDQETAVRLASELESPGQVNVLITGVLIAHWQFIAARAPDSERLRGILAQRIGSPYADIILGVSVQDLGADYLVAERWCRTRLISQAKYLEVLLQNFPDYSLNAQARAKSLILAGLATAPYVVLAIHPRTGAALSLYSGANRQTLRPMPFEEYVRSLGLF